MELLALRGLFFRIRVLIGTADPNLCTLPHMLRYRYKTCLRVDRLGLLPAVSVASEVLKRKLAAVGLGADTVGIIIIILVGLNLHREVF